MAALNTSVDLNADSQQEDAMDTYSLPTVDLRISHTLCTNQDFSVYIRIQEPLANIHAYKS